MIEWSDDKINEILSISETAFKEPHHNHVMCQSNGVGVESEMIREPLHFPTFEKAENDSITYGNMYNAFKLVKIYLWYIFYACILTNISRW